MMDSNGSHCNETNFLPVFTTAFTSFSHCPGKNSFCHGKNPTLVRRIKSMTLKYYRFSLQMQFIFLSLSLGQVQTSDSLASIAAHFSTTTSVLKSLNRLMSDLVYPGQVLTCVLYFVS